MQYIFNNPNLQFNTTNTGYYTLLFNNGAISGDLASLDLTWSSVLNSKMICDYRFSNVARDYVSDTVTFLGYSVNYYDDVEQINYLVINLNTNVTYFCLGLRTDEYAYYNSEYGHLGNGNDIIRDGYNTQVLSPINSLFTIEQGDNSTNSFLYDRSYDYQMPYQSGLNDFSVLFDYRLSSHNDIYYIRGEDYYFYTSWFEIEYDSGAQIAFTSGVDTTLNAEYERGYSNGKQSGLTQGREEGYSQGKADGIAQGRLEVGNYSSAMDFVGNGITQLTPIFGLEILPNITLGTVISIPIIIGVLSIIFRISKG